jgi:hypothetical protein
MWDVAQYRRILLIDKYAGAAAAGSSRLFSAGALAIRGFERSRWRGGRFRVLEVSSCGGFEISWVTEKGGPCDPTTQNDAGRTPAS